MQKITLQIDLKKLLWLKKVKILFRGLSNLNGEEIVGTFYKKESQKTKQKEFGVKKGDQKK